MQIQRGIYEKQEGPGPGFWVGVYRFVTHNILGFMAAAVFFHSTSYWIGKVEYTVFHSRNTVKEGHYQNPQELQIFIETEHGQIVPYYGTKDNKIPIGKDILPYGISGIGLIQNKTGQGKDDKKGIASLVSEQDNQAWKQDTKQFLEREAILSRYQSHISRLQAQNDSLKAVNSVIQEQQNLISLEEKLRTEYGLSPGEIEAVMRLRNDQ